MGLAHAPTEPQPEGAPAARPGGINRTYIGVGVALGVLTLVALGLAYAAILPLLVLAPILILLAAAQVYLQCVIYMHLDHGRRLFAMFWGGGLMVASVTVFALMILMYSH